MAETFQHLLFGFSIALEPINLLYAFLGCLVGTLIGVLPGLGPIAGIALLIPGIVPPVIGVIRGGRDRPGDCRRRPPRAGRRGKGP